MLRVPSKSCQGHPVANNRAHVLSASFTPGAKLSPLTALRPVISMTTLPARIRIPESQMGKQQLREDKREYVLAHSISAELLLGARPCSKCWGHRS